MRVKELSIKFYKKGIKKMKKTIISALSIAMLFSACSVKTANEMSKEIDKKLNQNELVRNAKSDQVAGYRNEALLIQSKKIDVGFYKKPLADAIREVAQLSKIGFDESFIPSREYTISIEYRGSLGGFLEEVKKSTGVSYKYRHNMLKVVNKQLVKRSIVENVCKVEQKPTINIALEDVSPIQVFKYFSQKHGFNFTFQTKYYSITGNERTKQELGKTSLFYSGCDPKEALYSFLSANDLVGNEMTPNRFLVKDYILKNIDIPTYFDYKYTSGQTLGDTKVDATSGSNVSVEEKFKSEFITFLKSFMSIFGNIKLSNRGYITIVDTPHKVAEIEKIIRTEIAKQSPMELSVSIVRITLNDGLETGANFNLELSGILNASNGVPPSIGTGDYTTDMTQGMSLQGLKGGLPQVFKALKQLGTTSIVREYNVKTRNGILTTFRAVDKIPYVTTSTIASTSSTQTSTEAKFANSGIIINMLPQLTENQETVNISTDILVSEYLGDKIFNTADGELKLPQITENEVQVPVSLKMGESAILTGFNLKEDTATRAGVPGAVEQNLYYTERLFGHFNDSNKATQLVVIVTPKKIEDF